VGKQEPIRYAIDTDRLSSGEPDYFTVGRILADELRRYEIMDWGDNVWDAADADSSGLEAAYASLLTADGKFREEEFEGIANPLVYMYRFALHEEFVNWRLAVLHGFCNLFANDAVVLAQYDTTWFSETEFEVLGFRDLGPTQFPAPNLPSIDREGRFMVRDNAAAGGFTFNHYPEDAPAARLEHEEWLASKVPWDNLC